MAKPIKHRDKWRIRWIDATGKRRSDVYETYNGAAHALRLREVEAVEVRRGQRPPEPPDKTFGELCDYWIENRAVQKRSGKHDVSIIRAHLRPAFGAIRLRVLTAEHSDKFTNERAHLDGKTIANHLTLLITMLNHAKALGWLASVPQIRKPRIAIEQDFSYLRTPAEVERFLHAARAEEQRIFALYATAVFTGMRAGELACLVWDDVEFTGRLVTVQRSFHGPPKNGDIRRLPILDRLLPVLREWRAINPLDIVFPNDQGGRLGESARAFQEILHRVLERARFPLALRRGKLRPYIHFHDLRHTFASHWMMNGGDLFKLQKILGHKDVAMTMRYAHLSPHAFQQDHARLDALLPPVRPRVFRLSTASMAAPAPPTETDPEPRFRRPTTKLAVPHKANGGDHG